MPKKHRRPFLTLLFWHLFFGMEIMIYEDTGKIDLFLFFSCLQTVKLNEKYIK